MNINNTFSNPNLTPFSSDFHAISHHSPHVWQTYVGNEFILLFHRLSSTQPPLRYLFVILWYARKTCQSPRGEIENRVKSENRPFLRNDVLLRNLLSHHWIRGAFLGRFQAYAARKCRVLLKFVSSWSSDRILSCFVVRILAGNIMKGPLLCQQSMHWSSIHPN
jgi:hypothetical protein